MIKTTNEWHEIAMRTPLDRRSIELRLMVLRALKGGGRGHVGPALSLIEILRVLYDSILKFNVSNPNWETRDRCLLSKGHGCLALYAILADKGFFSVEELDRFCEFDSILGGHPEPKTPGVEIASGSLGHGLAVGVGMAIAARLKKSNHQVFVIIGDGEMNEGSIWESALSAAHHQLDNLTILIDYNKMQSYGPVHEVLKLEPLAKKWESFGFQVSEVNGHDIVALQTVLSEKKTLLKQPRVLVCHTIKGKGVKPAEHNPSWHHKSKLAMKEMSDIHEALNLEINACAL